MHFFTSGMMPPQSCEFGEGTEYEKYIFFIKQGKNMLM